MSFQEKISKEAWNGTKTSVAHLIFFCSIAFSHVPGELRRKMDKKSEWCIFTCYSEQHKAYKLYNHVTKKIVLSIYVKFLEDKC